jgi:hypothetical protein
MRTRRFFIEPLESRHLFSGTSILSQLLASSAGAAPPNQTPTPPSGLGSAPAATPAAGPNSIASVSIRELVPSSSQTVDNRWDWLAQTIWYVPSGNLLAFATNQQLSTQLPISDQTLWNITQAVDGQIQGIATISLAGSAPSQKAFVGTVTDGGQIRIEFSNGSGQPPTTGIGQMRFVQGAWQMEMQMATVGSPVVTHWAYMAQLTPGVTPPDPSSTPESPSSLSNNWTWLQGSQWTISDSALLGTASAGVFEIDRFSGGYFWGTGTSTQPFNVMGSVTPEGNLLLLVSVNGAQAVAQTGVLQQTSTGGQMTLRSYEGQPAAGSAWTISVPTPPAPNLITPSLRSLLG